MLSHSVPQVKICGIFYNYLQKTMENPIRICYNRVEFLLKERLSYAKYMA